MSQLLALLLISLTLSSCGYKGMHDESGDKTTLSIPYFKGDDKGMLTDAVIKAIASSGTFSYLSSGGEYILEGKILSDQTETIGYQYDKDPLSGKPLHRLTPNERRSEMTVALSLIESRSAKVIAGPYNLTASSDYDFVDEDSLHDLSFYDQKGEKQSVLAFSLGQLESAEGAKSASLPPIYHQLAEQIAEGLSSILKAPREEKAP